MTNTDLQEADRLREQGNRAIKAENFGEADLLYTRAIVKDPQNYKLYSNRAMARLRTRDFEGAALDAEAASRINPRWMKAYRHAAVAYGQLRRHDDAVAAAMQAYSLCLDATSPAVAANRNDLISTSELVLASRRARWDARERERVAGSDPLLAECIDLIWSAQAAEEKRLDTLLERGDVDRSGHERDVEAAWQEARRKEKTLRDVFARQDPSLKERNVPDCFIDRISFNFMVDPVVTRHGQSYERAYLLEHLSRNATDPLTGEPLSKEELRPNLALREACEAFLNENEWAADF